MSFPRSQNIWCAMLCQVTTLLTKSGKPESAHDKWNKVKSHKMGRVRSVHVNSQGTSITRRFHLRTTLRLACPCTPGASNFKHMTTHPFLFCISTKFCTKTFSSSRTNDHVFGLVVATTPGISPALPSSGAHGYSASTPATTCAPTFHRDPSTRITPSRQCVSGEDNTK